MKHFGNFLSVFLGISAAAATPVQDHPNAQVRPALDASTEPVVSYSGYKVVRLSTGENIDKVNGIVADLRLEAWKITRTFADVMVPPEKLDAFNAETETAGLTVSKTLYEDLGVAVQAEREELLASK